MSRSTRRKYAEEARRAKDELLADSAYMIELRRQAYTYGVESLTLDERELLGATPPPLNPFNPYLQGKRPRPNRRVRYAPTSLRKEYR